jgi:23S rRNA (cytosine1962-C5)-methyltransferase
MMPAVILKPHAGKSLLRRHPWIFSGAVATVQGMPQIGETVDIIGADGVRYGWGAYSPHSQIRVRVWSFDADEDISADFFRLRLQQALASRSVPPSAAEAGACRLVNAESDGLPGLIVDRYCDYLVCQFLSAGAEFWKDTLIEQLIRLVPCQGIYERSDVEVREKEGLTQRRGVLFGRQPPELLEFREGPYRFLADIIGGHKTGFYLDQRDNRHRAAEYAKGAQVLNCFSYTGAFAVAAMKGGAESIVNIDASSAALELSRRQAALNGLDPAKIQNVEGNVFGVLRSLRQEQRRFDLVILDPPKFAESRRQLTKAGRGYKDINLLAFQLLRPGGLLMTFSCSGLVGRELFQKIVADAALDAGRDAQILRWLCQAADHPTALNFPEGSYLKGLICHVR